VDGDGECACHREGRVGEGAGGDACPLPPPTPRMRGEKRGGSEERMRKRRKARRRVAGVESGVIEQRKAALQRQGQELDRRLVEIDRQGQQLQQERGQVIANLNAVSGALQLCEDLLKATADSRQPAAEEEPGLTLEQLRERIGADSVEVVEGDGTPAVD